MRNLYRCFVALCCVLLSTATFAQTTDAFKAQQLSLTTAPELDYQFKDYRVYQMDIKALDAQVKGRQPQYDFRLDLGAEYSWDLELIPNDLRGPNYQIRNSSGEVLRGNPEITTFRGYIKDQPFSEVRLTIDEDLLYGYIEFKGKQVFIEPLWHFLPDAPRDRIIAYRPEDVKPRNTTCGYSEMLQREDGFAPGVDDTPGPNAEASSSATINCYEVELAMAADYSMFTKYGSVGGVEGHVLGVLNNVQGNYDDEFEDEIQFVVVGAFYSDCPSCDPWTASNGAGALLSSFRSWGNSGGFGFSYDVAELWTNRNFTGSTIGIAYLNAICTNNRYHCIQDFTTNANLLRVVVAHELGHNFSCRHDAGGSSFIMAPSVNNSSTWSAASINDLDNFTNVLASLSNCLTSCANLLPPQANFVADVTDGCVPLTVNFSDLSINSPSSWTWTFPGGSPASSTAQNPTVIYDTPGTYDVILQVLNAAGTDVSTRVGYIQVSGPPSVGFDTFVSDATVVFLNTSVDATDYLWDFGDGSSSFAASPTHTYSEDGVYTVTLIANNACGTSSTSQQITILTQPIPDFEANITSGCGPLTVFFSNLSSSNSEELFWLFPGGDPATSEGENPVVTYSSPGVYDVTLQVTNPAGTNTLSRTSYITVEVSPVPGYTFTQNGNDVDFTNTSTNANSFSWDFGDGNGSTDVDPLHTYAMDGTYNVILTAFGSCDTLTFEQTITIANFPTAGFSADLQTGCAPLTVNFTDQSSANVLGWNWSFPGGNPASSTDQNPSVTYNAAGTYDVGLIVSNGTGNDTLSLAAYVTVDDLPSVGFSSSVNGTMVDFTNNSTNATTFNWDFGDGNGSTDANPTHTYAMDGVYTVTLTATNNCGPVTTTETVTIVTAPTADFSADNVSGCAPLVVQFNNLSSLNATDYAWSFPGGDPATSTDQAPVVTYNTAGTYDVMLTVSNAAGSDMVSLSNYITVDDVPSIGFSSSVNGTSVDFTNTSTNATTYSWDFGDGNGSTDVNPTHTYAMDGTYTVTLTATNNCGPVT
ncbi:MAG: PKD domain-containing protein, partial [Bacteroidota bacterium]